MEKLIPIALLLAGESLAVYSEIIVAKDSNSLFKMLLLMTLAGFFLILGYLLGMKYIGDIWVIAAVSIAGIVVVEPPLIYFIFREIPSTGAIVGLILGVLAIFAALFIK